MVIKSELEKMSVAELKAYAKKKYIKLYSVNKEKIIDSIIEIENVREHHGDAFRTWK